ncbi:MAG TPA: hypothetical protein ENK05_08725 [Gammaproteobacteria bacterium]|nr:hypothetical protein [Gammaproteobacteria bacterium]
MPILPRDLLECATALIKENGETFQRAAVSRAYYACYHAALPVAERLAPVDVNGGLHKKLYETFIKERELSYKSVGYMLRQSHSDRIRADYHLQEEIGRRDAETVIYTAIKILNKIDSLDRDL